MTTRTRAEALLFDEIPLLNKGKSEKVAAKQLEPMTTSPSPTRQRVKPIYCPSCSGWVEVRLQPVPLRCTSCGLEARP